MTGLDRWQERPRSDAAELLEDQLRSDEQDERMQAYWASPEGVARQHAEFRALYGSEGMGGNGA